MKNIFTYIVLAVISLTSCTEIIEIDLDEQIATRLVVDASIVSHINDPENGYQEIFLSKSRNYFDNVNDDNSLSDAIVKISNNQTGEEIVFTESATEKGKYITNDLKAKVGNGYTLNIEAQLDGETQEFIGHDSIETAAPIIEEINLVEELSFEGIPFYETTINFKNPKTHDYFKFEVFYNDSLIINNHGNPNFFFSLIDDSFLGPFPKEYRVVDQNIKPKEAIPPFNLRVTMKRISFQAYSYWRRLYVNAASGNDTPQTEVKGSVSNITKPKLYALGTFMMSSESEKAVDITKFPGK